MNSRNFLQVLILVVCVFLPVNLSGGSEANEINSPGKTSKSSTSKDEKNSTSDSGDDSEISKKSKGKISHTSSDEIKDGGFEDNLPAVFIQPTDEVGLMMFKEYGAMFVAKGGAVPPPKVVFNNTGSRRNRT